MSPRDVVLSPESPSFLFSSHYLVPSRLERSDGSSPVTDVGDLRGKLAVVTVTINHVSEQEWLAVSVWGSIDGNDWGTKPLVNLPRKGYCGLYSAFLDLASHREVRYIQVRWTMGRWGNRGIGPVFGFSVTAEAAAAA